MTDEPRILRRLPIACSLSAADGQDQLARWRSFDSEYLLGTEDERTRYIARYTKVEDSETRLADLVAGESACCSFVDWAIDSTGTELRLIVSGTPESLAALSIR